MIKSKNTDTISIRISEKMKEQIESLAFQNNATQSEVVRYAINNLNKKQMSKEVKYFDSHNASVKVQQTKREAKKLSEMTKLIQSISESKEIKTIAELEAWVQDKTGFKNISFGADSLGLKEGYVSVKNMSKDISLSLDDLTPLHELKKDVIESIENEFKVYYTKEELKIRNHFIKVKEIFETLPIEYRHSSFVNREGKLINTKR